MTGKNPFKDKRLVSLLLLITAFITTVFVVYARKHPSIHSKKQPINEIASHAQMKYGDMLQESTMMDHSSDVTSLLRKKSTLPPLLAKPEGISRSSQSTIYKQREFQNDEGGFAFLLKNERTPVLLADNSAGIMVVVKDDKLGQETNEPLASQGISSTDFLPPFEKFGPESDGATQKSTSNNEQLLARARVFQEGGDANESPSAVPEPSTMLLLGTGLVGLAVWTRKRINK